MRVHNDRYEIDTYIEVTPSLDQYDFVFNTENIRTDGAYMARIFQINPSDGRSKIIAFVDLICASFEPCAVLEQNVLTVILFHAIVRINIDTGAVVQYVKPDSVGGLFEIHPVDGGYLIWGEGDIFRYDPSLNRVWNFTGRDIMVSAYRDKHFWFDRYEIHCRDWLGWHYVLDHNGKLLRDYKEFGDAEAPEK